MEVNHSYPAMTPTERKAADLAGERCGAIDDATEAVEQAAAKIVELVGAASNGTLPASIDCARIEYRQALARLAELKGGGA
jgi:hypothetical protein